MEHKDQIPAALLGEPLLGVTNLLFAGRFLEVKRFSVRALGTVACSKTHAEMCSLSGGRGLAGKFVNCSYNL